MILLSLKQTILNGMKKIVMQLGNTRLNMEIVCCKEIKAPLSESTVRTFK